VPKLPNNPGDQREAVGALYRELLGRAPDPEGLQHWAGVAERVGIDAVRAGIKSSSEFSRRANPEAPNEFRGYDDRELEILSSFANPRASPQPGFVVDFIGGRIRTSHLRRSARKLDGQLTPVPTPGDTRTDLVEWIGVLKSVRSARGQFVAMELGAGLGPWLVAGALAARSRGIEDIRLCGVEADPTHYALLRQNLDDNDLPAAQHVLLNAAVGVAAGRAKWPVIEEPLEDWGARPLEVAADPHEDCGAEATDYRGRLFARSIEIEIVSMRDLIIREDRWDLVHIDVQGLEHEICGAALSELNARVRLLVVGTHSRLLDGQMIALLYRAGWVLENERPAKFTFDRKAASLESMTHRDGVQVWRNPRLD
jgi:FkbM family methyltransferase